MAAIWEAQCFEHRALKAGRTGVKFSAVKIRPRHLVAHADTYVAAAGCGVRLSVTTHPLTFVGSTSFFTRGVYTLELYIKYM